jgi:tRNA 2-selenouridine synthase
MLQTITIKEFLLKANDETSLLLDARSPGEFRQGHIPGAVNLPLLNNQEREQIGITYKKKGRKAAVVRGFDLVGHKFADFITQVNKMFTGNDVILYCWRGGMRSNIMAWLLQMAGYNVYLLEKGYKEYRRRVLNALEQDYSFVVLGGKTGSGKTDLLQVLKREGEQTIDLEKFANHKGSAFGSLGMPEQPTNEHFENLLAEELLKLNNEKLTWIENESRNIGSIKIHDNIYNQIRRAVVIDIKISFEKRLERIINEYGSFSVDILTEKSKKIEKKLGPNNLKIAQEYLKNNDIKSWADMLLHYYDQNYDYSNSLRNPKTIFEIEPGEINQKSLAKELINIADQILKKEAI